MGESPYKQLTGHESNESVPETDEASLGDPSTESALQPSTGPDNKNSKVYAKTNEELQMQYNLVYKHTRGYIPDIHEYLKDVELDAISETVQSIRLKPGHARTNEEHQVLSEWNDYISRARELRRFQAEQIQNARENAPIDRRRETYLKAVSWSGEVQRKIAEQIQSNTETYSDGRLFTDAVLAEASKSEQGFLDLLDEVAEMQPKAIGSVASSLFDVLPRGRALAVLDKVLEKNPSSLVSYPKDFLRIYGPETFRDRFRQLAEADPSASLLVSIDAHMIDIVGKDVVKNIIDQEIRSDPFGIISRTRISRDVSAYVFNPDSGILDRKQLSSSLLRAIRGIAYLDQKISKTKAALPHLTEEDKKECESETDTLLAQLDYYALTQAETIVGKEKVKELRRDRLLNETGYTYINSWGEAKEVLGDDYEKWAEEVQDMKRPKISLSEKAWDEFFSSTEIAPDRKREVLDKIATHQPENIFYNPRVFLQSIPGEERGNFLARHVDQIDAETGFGTIEMWLPAISNDPEKQRQFLEEYIMASKDLNFTRFLVRKSSSLQGQLAIVNSLIPPDEMRRLVIKKAEISPGGCFKRISELREIFGGDEGLREFLDQKRQTSHTDFVQNLSRYKYLYSGSEILNILKEPNNHVAFANAILESAPVWGPFAGPDDSYALLMAHADKMGIDAFALKGALGHISLSPEQRDTFLAKVTSANPCATVWTARADLYNELNYPVDLQSVKSDAAAQAADLCLPRTLTQLWKDIDPYGDLSKKMPALREGAQLYQQISLIKSEGLDTLHEQIYTKEKVADEKNEVKLLELLSSCAELESIGVLTNEAIRSCESMEDLEIILSGALEQMLSAGLAPESLADATDADRRDRMGRFTRTMEGVSPFVTYTSQYHKSAQHRQILGQMFESISADSYSEWKFGTEEDFEQFKEKGWIPAKITPEQYELWQKDESRDFFESLQVSANETAGSVQRIILDNTEHLGELNINSIIQDTGAQIPEILSEIKKAIAANGIEIGEIKKKIQQEKANGTAQGEEFDDLLKQKAEAESKRKELGSYRDLTRLCMLSADEVTQGYILEGGKKVQRISNVISDLKSSVPAEGVFVIDRIADTIGSLSSGDAQRQNIITVDTGNPKVTIEIGENPVNSCQSYRAGQHNDCLLGYTDPNTKIITVSNEKGSMIARSVIRLLSNSEGKPELHVERLYSNSASATVSKVLYEHAMRKAESMNVPLRSSRGSLTPDSGFQNDESETTALKSSGARAPKVYVDSAGGAKSYGRYLITDAQIVRRTT